MLVSGLAVLNHKPDKKSTNRDVKDGSNWAYISR